MVAGNWKMNGSLSMASALSTGLLDAALPQSVETVVCPPFPYLTIVAEALRDAAIGIGAQDVYFESDGAFTGEVSTTMLTDCGCSHVIIGHSERRALFAESDEAVGRKADAALTAGLTPIICVGETLEQRERGETLAVIDAMLAAVTAAICNVADAVIAYEPVWAIGTGVTASPEQAQEVHAHIRGFIRNLDAGQADRTRILYGGSVKPGNAAELFGQPDIDGGLIGGAALKAEDFAAICRAAVTD